jgi:hypothetical protein
MMSRALDICARSQFKHVFAEADGEEESMRRVLVESGFEKIGDAVRYAMRQR